MRIPEEHSGILVAGDQSHLCNRQPSLEEAAYGLVAQVVEAEIIDARAGPQSVPGQADSIRRNGKDQLRVLRAAFHYLSGF